MQVEDAIKGIVTRSANDASVVVAEAIAGDEDEFAKLMTRKARALGMTRTVYKNASGLPDDDQVTTARDQAIARPRHPGALPELLQVFLDPLVHLPRPVDRQPQPSARTRRRRRRHQDRLHQRLRLQSGHLGASRKSPHRGGGHGRQQRRQPRREDARADQRQDRRSLDQADRADDRRGGRRPRPKPGRNEGGSQSRSEGPKPKPKRPRPSRSRGSRSPAPPACRHARSAVGAAEPTAAASRDGSAQPRIAAGSTEPIRPVLVKTLDGQGRHADRIASLRSQVRLR